MARFSTIAAEERAIKEVRLLNMAAEAARTGEAQRLMYAVAKDPDMAMLTLDNDGVPSIMDRRSGLTVAHRIAESWAGTSTRPAGYQKTVLERLLEFNPHVLMLESDTGVRVIEIAMTMNRDPDMARRIIEADSALTEIARNAEGRPGGGKADRRIELPGAAPVSSALLQET